MGNVSHETTISARLAAQFQLDRDHANRIRRIAPVRGAWPSSRRYVIGGVFADATSGKRYAVEIVETTTRELDITIWLAGRRLPENHRGDIRQIARDAYCKAFALAPVIRLGMGTYYRPTLEKREGVTL